MKKLILGIVLSIYIVIPTFANAVTISNGSKSLTGYETLQDAKDDGVISPVKKNIDGILYYVDEKDYNTFIYNNNKVKIFGIYTNKAELENIVNDFIKDKNVKSISYSTGQSSNHRAEFILGTQLLEETYSCLVWYQE